MPLLGREKGRGPTTRRSDDEFVVFLQGIPAHCRWQELKDLVRQTALHIRQAVVYDDSHGFPTGLGQIIVKNEDEAWRTYHRLSTNGWDGRSLIVTLARTSAPTKPIAGPTRSPPAMMQGYMSGHSTPPRSRGNMTVPSSPITPESAHSASPAYAYAEYGSMISPMTMPPPPFMPIMPDPMTHSLHSFPPSPLTHCSVYDAPGWNMMPMYPASPIQPLYDAGDCYAGYHQRKAQPNGTEPSTPSDSSQWAIYTKNLSSLSTPTHSLQGAVTTEQGRMTNQHDNHFQTHSSAITSSIDQDKQAASELDNTAFTSSNPRYSGNSDLASMNMSRSGSWDGAMASSHEDPEARDPAAGDRDGCSGRGQAVQGPKSADLSQPLVVDGSGLRKRSLELEMMSASAS